MSKCTEKGLLRLLNRNSWMYGSWNLDLQPFLISNVRGGLLIFDLHKNCVQVVIFGSNMTTHSFQMSVNFTQFLTPLLSVSIFLANFNEIWPLPFQVADLLNGQSETMHNVWSHQKSTNHLLQNSFTRQSEGKGNKGSCAVCTNLICMYKVWVATVFWVARTHLARPD